ncbi:hypothetical protein NFI96_022155, partial [Prochilodus magdalenae]
VLISSISGLVVEIRVKPGDNVTIYCDRTQQGKLKIVWIIKPSNEQQPPLIHLTEDTTPPHYSRVWNNNKGTYDLLVKNITESDLGLYYCALHEIKFTRGRNGERVREDVYHEGNRTTFLSFLGESVHSDLLTHFTLQTPSTPPVSDCSVCWKLLVSVCPACVLLASVISSTCVYCIIRRRTKGVRFSRISGEEVEVKVKPGANAVLSCDCNWKSEYSIVWFRNSSHEHMVIHNEAHPRYSILWSFFSTTSDLLVRNVSESDLGLYYCALQKTWPIRDEARACSGEDVCLYGNRTTRLSFHGKVSLVLVNTNVFIALDPKPQTPYTPPLSDCSACWKLLVSVCPVCVLLSSTCVYWIYRTRIKVGKQHESAVRSCETTRNPASRKHDKVGEDDVCYASLDLPGRGERRLKKKRVECSEFSTYSEDRTWSHWIHRLDNTTNTSLGDATLFTIHKEEKTAYGSWLTFTLPLSSPEIWRGNLNTAATTNHTFRLKQRGETWCWAAGMSVKSLKRMVPVLKSDWS